MDVTRLIPTTDPIPAPWPLLEVLDVVLFLVHIVLINIVAGGALLVLYHRLRGRGVSPLSAATEGKLPSLLALAVTFGIAPLLFMQVLYGHLFYSSSVLMARWWIVVIPALILGYYGLYLNRQQGEVHPALARVGIAAAALAFLYTGLMFVNNITLMLQPARWERWFDRAGGTLLNLADPTVLPRYLHFMVASVAVAGLASAVVWEWRRRRGRGDAAEHIRGGLRLFAWATIVQALTGFWWLLALPDGLMRLFMGGDLLRTILLAVGIVLAVLVVVLAFRGRLMVTLGHLVALLALMVTVRALLRASYLSDFFTFGQLELRPQYGVLLLFLAVLAAGVWAVVWMARQAWRAEGKEVTP